MKTNSIGFIGGGRITKIFLQGFKNKSVLFESIKVFEPKNKTINVLASDFPDITIVKTVEEVGQQQLVIVAVHPPLVVETLQKIRDIVTSNTIVLSLAPKITLQKMASVLPTKKLVRMIPNATSIINEGFNPVSFYPDMDEKEKTQIIDLFKPLGEIFETEEKKLEAYAIVSAMLPTYFWFQWLEIERIGIEMGLTVFETRKAVKSTLKKAIKLYYNAGLTPANVIDLIPVKPIADFETEITDIFDTKLMELFDKIKP